MKLLRAHDYPVATAPPVPNLRALRRIMAAFIVAAAICFAICITLIFRQANAGHAVTRRAINHCICGGHCLR